MAQSQTNFVTVLVDESFIIVITRIIQIIKLSFYSTIFKSFPQSWWWFIINEML